MDEWGRHPIVNEGGRKDKSVATLVCIIGSPAAEGDSGLCTSLTTHTKRSSYTKAAEIQSKSYELQRVYRGAWLYGSVAYAREGRFCFSVYPLLCMCLSLWSPVTLVKGRPAHWQRRDCARVSLRWDNARGGGALRIPSSLSRDCQKTG